MSAATPALTRLGWTLLLVLWQTALLALLVAAWDRIQPAGARHRHERAFLALLATVPLGIFSYCLLASAPASVRELTRVASTRSAGPGAAQDPSTASDVRVLEPSTSLMRGASAVRRFASLSPALEWGASLWMVVAALLALRIAGGLWRVIRVRRRSTLLAEPGLVDAAHAMARGLGIAGGVTILESSDVEAPIATGWRRPAVILPLGLAADITPSRILPLIAHELAHVQRGDSLRAALQALVEALVFFSPGARWLSSRARLAREQSCDDVAVRVCGDRAAYASALAALVGIPDQAPSLAAGAVAPRLADRIRRVLEGEANTRLTPRRAALLVLALVATATSGFWVAALSLAGAAASAGPSENRGNAAVPPLLWRPASLSQSMPARFAPESRALWDIATPPGAPVGVRGYSASGRIVERVQVRNVSERTVTSLTLALVIEFWPPTGALSRPAPLSRPAARIVRSAAVPLALAPGQVASVSTAFPRWDEVGDWAEQHGLNAHAVITAIAAELDGRGTWEVTPRAGALSYTEAFHVPKPFVSKALLDRSPSRADPMGFCHDDRGLEYSRGALVPIGDAESSSAPLACCAHGAWHAWNPSTRCF